MNEDIRLEKKLSPINVWSLALGCIIGWGAFVMPGNTFLGQAGPLGTAIAMGIAAIIMIIIALSCYMDCIGNTVLRSFKKKINMNITCYDASCHLK